MPVLNNKAILGHSEINEFGNKQQNDFFFKYPVLKTN